MTATINPKNKSKKKRIYYIYFLFLTLSNVYAQTECVDFTQATASGAISNFTCSYVETSTLAQGSFYKIPINTPMTIQNTYEFSTEGRSPDSITLYLYDPNDNLLTKTDSDIIQYTIPATIPSGSYLIVSGNNCTPLNYDTIVSYRASNQYDTYPVFDDFSDINTCLGNTYDFNATPPSNNSTAELEWSTSDNTIASIDSTTGEIVFLQSGTVKVQVKTVGGNCLNYKIINIVNTESTAITHE